MKEHVSFTCPVCQFGIRPHEQRIETTGPRDDTLYYMHATCAADVAQLVANASVDNLAAND